jgi:hypothetical protein
MISPPTMLPSKIATKVPISTMPFAARQLLLGHLRPDSEFDRPEQRGMQAHQKRAANRTGT